MTTALEQLETMASNLETALYTARGRLQSELDNMTDHNTSVWDMRTPDGRYILLDGYTAMVNALVALVAAEDVAPRKNTAFQDDLMEDMKDPEFREQYEATTEVLRQQQAQEGTWYLTVCDKGCGAIGPKLMDHDTASDRGYDHWKASGHETHVAHSKPGLTGILSHFGMGDKAAFIDPALDNNKSMSEEEVEELKQKFMEKTQGQQQFQIIHEETTMLQTDFMVCGYPVFVKVEWGAPNDDILDRVNKALRKYTRKAEGDN